MTFEATGNHEAAMSLAIRDESRNVLEPTTFERRLAITHLEMPSRRTSTRKLS